MEIPKKLRKHFGDRVRLVKSLETESQSEAERLVLAVVADWKNGFEMLKTGGAVSSGAGVMSWEDRALSYHDDIAAAERARATGPERHENEKGKIEELADIYAGILDDEVRDIAWADPEKARSFQRLALGQALAYMEHAQEWRDKSKVAAKTSDMRQSDLRRFAKDFPYVHLVTVKAVRRWADNLLAEGDLKAATVKRIISANRGYWTFLERNGYIERKRPA